MPSSFRERRGVSNEAFFVPRFFVPRPLTVPLVDPEGPFVGFTMRPRPS